MVVSLDKNYDLIKVPYKDILTLYGLFVFLVLIYYFLPLQFRYLTSIALLALFARSNKDHWWMALFFLIYSGPIGLFSEATRDASTGLPLFSIGSGVSFSFTQLFVLIAFVKALNKKRPFRSVFKSQLLLIFIYFGLLLMLAFLYGSPSGVIIDNVKKAIFWILIFVLPALINEREKTYEFIYLIIPVILLIFIDSGYFIVTGGNYIYDLINPSSPVVSLGIESQIDSDSILRYRMFGWNAVLIGYILSLALAQLETRNSLYFYILAAMAFLIVTISATRSWFVIFIIIAVFTLWRARNLSAIITISLLILSFIYISRNSSTSSNKQFVAASERIMTVVDINEEGSLSNRAITGKIEQDFPVQIQLFRQNPITGWGFTEHRGSEDVGIIGHMVEVGLVGIGLFFYLWYSYLVKFRIRIKNKALPKCYKNLLAVLQIGFIGLLISHFTTNQIFGITYYTVVLSLYFWLSDFFLRESMFISDKILMNAESQTYA